MEIKLNKALSICISIVYLIIFTVGIPVLHFLKGYFFADSCIESSCGASWIVGLPFFLMCLSPFLIGLWLYVNSINYGIDKWTWLALGLVYGNYALVLLILMLIIEKANLKIDIFKSVQNLLILLIICFVLTMLSKMFFNQNFYKSIIDVHSYSDYANYSYLMVILTTGFMIVMNIFIAISEFIKGNVDKVSIRSIWIIAIIVLGLLPIILHKGIVELRNKNNAA